MTPYEASSLWAQWVGSVSGALAVVVAAVFGYLTLASNRRSKDAQQRATLVAAHEAPEQAQSLRSGGEPGAHFSIRHKSGETWLLVNNGPDVAYMVDIGGLTDLDKKRLQGAELGAASLGQGEAKEFVLISRFTLSGPANVVVLYRLQPEGAQLKRVLQVPAP